MEGVLLVGTKGHQVIISADYLRNVQMIEMTGATGRMSHGHPVFHVQITHKTLPASLHRMTEDDFCRIHKFWQEMFWSRTIQPPRLWSDQASRDVDGTTSGLVHEQLAITSRASMSQDSEEFTTLQIPTAVLRSIKLLK